MIANATLNLAGNGAAYIRVSTDQQDTARQFSGIESFEKRHRVTIPAIRRFVDEAWARDKADQRPEFQRLIKTVERGEIRWIIVDKLDRFGTKDAHQLIAYIYRLREAGCKLYDVSGKEWTGEDIATIITAVVEGDKSRGEQTEKSYRVLGGKVERARNGEWQGGPVPLGLDVGCFCRQTGQEKWRVIFEGIDEEKNRERLRLKRESEKRGMKKRIGLPLKRRKVYPDGTEERFDGPENFPRFQPTEVLRLTPSQDQAKLEAARSIFKRYATEAVSFTDLAHYLNSVGFRTSYGGRFQGHHLERMLRDPIYLGYYIFNRSRAGKFNRYRDGRVELEYNYDQKMTMNDRKDWVWSERRLFPPIIDRKTWDAVQKKLDNQSKRPRSPRSAGVYFAGLVHCGNCGAPMVSQQKPSEYYCGTYHKHLR